jgi:hypothetical protein
MKNTVGLLGLAVLVLGSLTACVPAEGSGSSCKPEPLEVSTEVVSPGDSITISSPKAACVLDPRTYRISLVSQVDFRKIVDEPISVAVGPDGSFSKSIEIPDAATPGDVAVVIEGSVRDECDPRASCAGYSIQFAIA